MPEKKFDKNKYDQQFHKDNYKKFYMLFRIGSDNDIIDKLSNEANRTDYIRRLIRADIEREKQANRNPKQK